MTGISLQRAAALSLAAHVAFFILTLLITRNSFISFTPKTYTVTIVSPKDKARPMVSKSPKVDPAKKKAGAIKEPKVQPKKMPVSKTRPEREAPSMEYVTKKIESLKAQKERERKDEAIEAIKQVKLSSIVDQLAASKTTGASEGPSKSDLLDNYTGRVQADIYKEWVFPNIDISNLEALISVKILRSGTIVVNSFKKSSGNRLFDSSALKAINKASPVDPPPFDTILEDVIIRFVPYEE